MRRMTGPLLRSATLLAAALLAISCGGQQPPPAAGGDDGHAEVVVAATPGSPQASAPPPAGEAATISITIKPSTVGDRFEHTSRLQMDGEVKIKGTAVPVTRTQKMVYSVEILAVDGGRTVKQRVRYQAFEEHEDPPSKETPNAPVLEKNYVLERKGDALVITDEKGAPLKDSEVEYMMDAWKRFGKPKKLNDALAKARLEVGEEAPEVAAAFASDHNDGEDEVKSVKMRLREVRGDVAVFDYTMEGSSSDLKGVVMKMKGTREVQISTGLELKDGGNVTLQGGALETGVNFDLRGTGEDTAKRL